VEKILIVDDDAQFRRVLRTVLNICGYEVHASADGTEALDAMSAEVPDLVLLDWHMPGLDGLQVCRALRTHSKVPVIMVSSLPSLSKQEVIAAGANDFLPKPFSTQDLLDRIDALLHG
jgi:DNA-binding response OmpR family regulator